MWVDHGCTWTFMADAPSQIPPKESPFSSRWRSIPSWHPMSYSVPDVRVVQAGDGLRLALEPLLQIGVRGDMLGEHLDGDGAVESGIPRLVDFSHAAAPEDGGSRSTGATARTC